MKKIASLALAALALTSASAQENTPKLSVLSDIKFSGYVMSQYQYTGQDSKESNSFNIRMVRMALDGRLMEGAAPGERQHLRPRIVAAHGGCLRRMAEV